MGHTRPTGLASGVSVRPGSPLGGDTFEPEEGLKLMEAEALRIKKLTEYQSEIQQTIERMASRDIVDDSDCTDNDDMSDHSIPDWMKEYPSEDDSPGEASQSTQNHL